jgi:hypothetical protein
MKHDYLWDRSGDPDPQVQELENLLRTFRSTRPPPDFPEISPLERRTVPRRHMFNFALRPAFAGLAFAGAVSIIVVSWWFAHQRDAYPVVTLKGSPRVGESHIGGSGRLRVGQWLETDSMSSARVDVGDVGVIEIEPNTRIGLVKAGSTDHRLSLARGTMHAFVWSPPGQFSVYTPSARAVDLGCGYTLQVADDGSGFLRVISGWVAFENEGRESFVPAGAMCETRAEYGPGTPYQQDVPRAFRAALRSLDFGTQGGRNAALDAVLSEARREDAFTLWHLLRRVTDDERPRVYGALAGLVPPPAGVTREGVLSGDRKMTDQWWNELELGDLEGWRLWKQPWQTSR